MGSHASARAARTVRPSVLGTVAASACCSGVAKTASGGTGDGSGIPANAIRGSFRPMNTTTKTPPPHASSVLALPTPARCATSSQSAPSPMRMGAT
jgi:hypothetical protein